MICQFGLELPFLPLSMTSRDVKFPGGRIDCTPPPLDTASHTPFWIPLIASIAFLGSADDFCNVNVNENSKINYIDIILFVMYNLYEIVHIGN